jgi:STE24 endopeptidase
MTSSQLSAVFLLALFAGLMVRFWLAMRQMLHVRHHRGAVPAAFAASISLDAHQKAADYTVARVRLGMIDLFLSTCAAAGPDPGWRPASPARSGEPLPSKPAA